MRSATIGRSPMSPGTSWTDGSGSTRKAASRTLRHDRSYDRDRVTVSRMEPRWARTTGTGDSMTREAVLARTLVELADTLVDDFDVVDLLTRLADRCVEVLDVEAAGIMLAAPNGDLRVMASSSEAMRMLELFELQAQEGPCLDCHHTGLPITNQDLTVDDGRWPRFSAEAVAAGFPSVHAVPMRLR